MNTSGHTAITSQTDDVTGTQTLEVIGRADRFNEWMFKTIKPYLKGEVLEIGSGLGNISRHVVSNGFSVTLSDYSLHYQQYLKDHFSRFPNVKSVLSIDLQHPSFADHYSSLKEKYDCVFLLNVIEHLKDDVQALENCRFLLKRNGHLIILAPAYPFLFCRFDKELGHFRRYTKNTLSRLFTEDSFNILHRQYFNFIGIAGWLFFGKLLNRKLIGSGEMSAFNKLVPVFKIADQITLKKAGLSVITIGKKT